MWARITPSSSYFSRAALLRATHLIQSGRYTAAEKVLLQALTDPAKAVNYELERALARLYRFEGRFDDVRRVVRASWCRSNDPAGLLKELWAHDHSPMPVEAMKRSLESADDDDDRVWLGRANQAILTGRFAAASDWLDRCLKRRPDDPSFWQARLDLALANDDLAGFWTAARKVPADRFDAAGVHTLRAWLAARRGDASLEQQELTDLVQLTPGNAQALERLAALMFQAGRSRDAEQLHRRKAEIDRAYANLRKILLDEPQMVNRADELAELATALGRKFDAQGWAILAEARRRGDGFALSRSGAQAEPALPADLVAKAMALSAPFADRPGHGSSAGPMLADRLSDLRPAAGPGSGAAEPHIAAAAGARPPGHTQFSDDAEAVGSSVRLRQRPDCAAPAARNDVGGRGAARLRRRRLARRLLRPGWAWLFHRSTSRE